MAKIGRPPKYETLEEVRQAQRDAANAYYHKNAEKINQKARDKRKSKKEEEHEQEI